MKWTGRVVTDARGDAGAVVLDDESTARVVLEDWLHDYYEFDGEWSAERSARAVYDYLASWGEAATMSRTAVSLGTTSLALGDDRGESGEEALAGSWWRCGRDGEGWIMNESDVREAAEYLRAVAGEN